MSLKAQIAMRQFSVHSVGLGDAAGVTVNVAVADGTGVPVAVAGGGVTEGVPGPGVSVGSVSVGVELGGGAVVAVADGPGVTLGVPGPGVFVWVGVELAGRGVAEGVPGPAVSVAVVDGAGVGVSVASFGVSLGIGVTLPGGMGGAVAVRWMVGSGVGLPPCARTCSVPPLPDHIPAPKTSMATATLPARSGMTRS